MVSFKNVAQSVALFELEDAQRHRLHHEIDPVCRMGLDSETAPAQLPFRDQLYYFCSFACAQKFVQAPENYVKS
jgi:YHS domain-containing protein